MTDLLNSACTCKWAWRGSSPRPSCVLHTEESGALSIQTANHVRDARTQPQSNTEPLQAAA